VTVPRGVARRHADELVASRGDWIERALQRVADHADHLERTRELPLAIELRASGERITVRYASGVTRALERAGELRVSGADAEAHAVALDAWVHRAAARRLPTMLAQVSSASGLAYQHVAVRAQRTRWGSMSRRGTVSLNRSLIFLPEDLARYVMLHELVHGEVFDHSANFWRRLAEFDPACREKAAAVREAWRYVPAWAMR